MAPAAPARSASSARRACGTRELSPSWTARPRPSRACCAIPTKVAMSDEPVSSEPVDAPSAAAPADPAELQKERDDYYDRWMRKAAEFDNYRRRVEKERREQADQAVVNLLQELLLVVDDFDRALLVDAGESGEGYRKGIQLI